MFEYELAGKQVILILYPEILSCLDACGIFGSPLVARVNKMEEAGLWLENPSFRVCPAGSNHIYDAKGQAMCMAHVFVPAKAILSVVVFPSDVKDLEEDPNYHRIGFRPETRQEARK